MKAKRDPTHQRAHNIGNACSLALFDKELKGQPHCSMGWPNNILKYFSKRVGLVPLHQCAS